MSQRCPKCHTEPLVKKFTVGSSGETIYDVFCPACGLLETINSAEARWDAALGRWLGGDPQPFPPDRRKEAYGPHSLSTDDEIRRAVEAAAWTFVRFGGRGLTVNGREFDVIRFSACKGGLVAWVTVMRGESAFAPFVEHVELQPSIVSAVRVAAGIKVGVDVRDNQCAMDELAKLMTHPRPGGFSGYVAAISALGWTVDREHMWENDYDFTWSIPARRGEDRLAFGALFSGALDKTEPLHLSEFGGARMVEDGVSWSLDVRVTAPARELADALLRG